MAKLPPPLPSVVAANAARFRQLTVFHYVLSGLSLMGGVFLSLHYCVMNMTFGHPDVPNGGQNVPFDTYQFFAAFRWFYIAMGLMMAVSVVINLASGYSLFRRKYRVFSIAVASVDCVIAPLGIVLGVFTIMHLVKDSVIEEYSASTPRQGSRAEHAGAP